MARPAVLKNAIYQSALHLFGEKGLAGTSIRDIARRANVSEGSMYRHWPSKLALGWDIFKTHLEILAGDIRVRMQEQRTPANQVRVTILTFYELFDSDRSLFRFILLNQHELWPRLGDTADDPVTLWGQFVSTHLDVTAPGAPPAQLAVSLTLGMILQPAISGMYGSISTPLVQHVDAVAAQVCRVLGFAPETTKVFTSVSDQASTSS